MPGDLEGLLENNTPSIAEAAPPENAAPVEATQEQDNTPGDKDPAAVPPAAADSQEGGPLVPRKALEDERRKRQEHERRLVELERHLQNMQQPRQQQQQQQPPAPPNPWEDPEGAMAYQQQQFAYQLFETRVSLGQDIMRARHQDYDEVVRDFAMQAQQDPNLHRQLVNHPNPASFAYEQGRLIRFWGEVGGDPEAYKAKLREQWQAEASQQTHIPQSPAAQALAPKAPAPKSLAGTTSAQPRDQRGRFSGPASLDDILG